MKNILTSLISLILLILVTFFGRDSYGQTQAPFCETVLSPTLFSRLIRTENAKVRIEIESKGVSDSQLKEVLDQIGSAVKFFGSYFEYGENIRIRLAEEGHQQIALPLKNILYLNLQILGKNHETGKNFKYDHPTKVGASWIHELGHLALSYTYEKESPGIHNQLRAVRKITEDKLGKRPNTFELAGKLEKEVLKRAPELEIYENEENWRDNAWKRAGEILKSPTADDSNLVAAWNAYQEGLVIKPDRYGILSRTLISPYEELLCDAFAVAFYNDPKIVAQARLSSEQSALQRRELSERRDFTVDHPYDDKMTGTFDEHTTFSHMRYYFWTQYLSTAKSPQQRALMVRKLFDAIKSEMFERLNDPALLYLSIEEMNKRLQQKIDIQFINNQ